MIAKIPLNKARFYQSFVNISFNNGEAGPESGLGDNAWNDDSF